MRVVPLGKVQYINGTRDQHYITISLIWDRMKSLRDLCHLRRKRRSLLGHSTSGGWTWRKHTKDSDVSCLHLQILGKDNKHTNKYTNIHQHTPTITQSFQRLIGDFSFLLEKRSLSIGIMFLVALMEGGSWRIIPRRKSLVNNWWITTY